MWAYSGSTESWLMESTLQKLRFMRGERKRRQTDKTDLGRPTVVERSKSSNNLDRG